MDWPLWCHPLELNSQVVFLFVCLFVIFKLDATIFGWELQSVNVTLAPTKLYDIECNILLQKTLSGKIVLKVSFNAKEL